MSEKNKENENNIILKITQALSDIDHELLIKSESYPFCTAENYNISEILDDLKKKEEQEEDDIEIKIGNYLIQKTLGKGTFGKVKLGIYLPTHEKVAIKILDKSRIVEKDDEIRVKREFEMLTLFSHPNVILVAEIFENSQSFYSVMEYCEGGELFNYIVKNRRLCQDEAAFFFYQLINGLEYIHSLGIVHRDLKPENLLLTKDHLLKIIDFGLSNYFTKDQKDLLITPCGSPCYASPEMVAGKKYNGFKIDVWSSGIILYAMLCGYLPFEDKDNDILFEKILECKLVFPKFISKMGKNLIQKILVTDPDKRITIPEIKKHPFYLKGKELFEKEFKIYEIENDVGEINNEGDINNIMDIHIINDKKTENKENEDINKNKNKIKVNGKNNKGKIINKEKKKINKENLKLKDIDNENFAMRLNTDYDEEIQSLNLRKKMLPDVEKEINDLSKKIKNSSSKKMIKKIEKTNINNKNVNKYNVPLKQKEDFIKSTINNNYNMNKNEKEEPSHKIELNSHYMKLNKQNKYKNIKDNLRKNNIGKSVNIRKISYINKYKNLVHDKINNTKIIKSKINSKEKSDKSKILKKENVYVNNINNINNINNNTIDNEIFRKKLGLKLNIKHNNDFHNNTKKTHSTARKNLKLSFFPSIDNQKNKNYLYNLFNIQSKIKKYKNKLNDSKLKNLKINDNIKMELINSFDNSKADNKKERSNILKDGKNQKIKINKKKLKIGKIYNNNINKNQNNNMNIIDNTEEEKNYINQKGMETDIRTNKVKIDNNLFGDENINIPKIIGENIAKNNLFYIKNYLNNNVEKNNYTDRTKDNIKKHRFGLHTDILNSFENKKNSKFNFKKMLIKDFEQKIKKREKIKDKLN